MIPTDQICVIRPIDIRLVHKSSSLPLRMWMIYAKGFIHKFIFEGGYHVRVCVCVQILNKLSHEINTFKINYACLVNALYMKFVLCIMISSLSLVWEEKKTETSRKNVVVLMILFVQDHDITRKTYNNENISLGLKRREYERKTAGVDSFILTSCWMSYAY